MTTGGWIFMLSTCTAIIALFAYCLYRTLHGGKDKRGEQR
jgi:hypothetical protein